MIAPVSPTLSIGDVLNAANRALGVGWRSDEALEVSVKAAAKRFIDQLASLRRPGSVEQQRARQYHVLRSFDARYCSVILGWPKKNEGPRTHDEILAIAHSLNARRDCGEPIRSYPKKKVVGERWISIFGVKRRALQRLAREVLDATVSVSPYDYCRQGRGANRALLAMKSAAEKQGGRWFHTADIRDCYGSFDREKLISLIPLPRAVIENCILIPEGAEVLLQISAQQQASEQAVRRGIPQGSLASPAVAAFLLRPVLDKLSGKLVICHGDDIVTATRTKKECETNKDILAQACFEHPAGPLIMKTNNVARLGTPIDLLGYRMRYIPKFFGGGVRFTPSPAGFEKFYARIEVELLKTKWSDDHEDIAIKKVANWQAGLSLWDTSDGGDLLVWLELVQYRIPWVRQQLKKAAGVGIYAKHASD